MRSSRVESNKQRNTILPVAFCVAMRVGAYLTRGGARVRPGMLNPQPQTQLYGEEESASTQLYGQTQLYGEEEIALRFLEEQQKEFASLDPDTPKATEKRALVAMCRLLFNLNEFVYLD